MSFDVCVHRELWVDATWADQVQSDFNLGEDEAPQAEREFWVGGGEAGDEMILVGADSTFRGIASMAMWRCELEIDVLFMHVVAKCLACFVVELLQFRFETRFFEAVENIVSIYLDPTYVFLRTLTLVD